jgi:hypothetical protein
MAMPAAAGRGQFERFSGLWCGDRRGGEVDACRKPFPHRTLRQRSGDVLARSVVAEEVDCHEEDQQVRDEQGHPVSTGKVSQGEESHRPHGRDFIRTASGHIQ